MLERHGSLYDYVLGKLRSVNKSSLALQKYGTDENHCEHQIRLVSTYFSVHRQDANIHARYIHRACCSGDWISAENHCSCGTRILLPFLIWSDQGLPRISISMDMKPSMNVIPSTHQTPPLRTPILNIPPS